MGELVRCRWAVEHPELLDYHDLVWGVPTHDDQAILAAYGQCILHAGLLWTAMLKKRSIFAAAFEDWQVERVAAYDGLEIERLMQTPGVMHNAVKLRSVVWNAGCMLAVKAEFGSFATYIWRFTEGVALDGQRDQARARRVADELSNDLRHRKFKFAGPATAYGLMQDIGMVNDHDRSCYWAPRDE